MTHVLLFEDVYGFFGGIEKVINNIIENANPEKYSFSLCVNHLASEEYLSFLNDHHVQIYELEDRWEKNPVKRHLEGYKLFRLFLKKHSFDILHFHVSNAIDMEYVSIAKKAGFSIRIAHCHNDEATSSFKRLVHYCFKPFFSGKASFNIACSDKAGQWLFPRRIIKSGSYQTIPNGISIDHFAFSKEKRKALRKEFGASEKTLLVMHVGRFNKQKNQEKAISAFRQVHAQNPDSKLVFFGAGDNRLLQEITQKSGLMDAVVFHTPVININEYYNAFDCFVFPSLYEGFGLVVIEAETNGLRCVVSDRVPSFVIFSEKACILSLDASDTEWAKAILSSPVGNRKDETTTAKNRGFEQGNQAMKIFGIYQSEFQKKNDGK